MELEQAKRDYDEDMATADSQIAEARRLLKDLFAASKRLQENHRLLDLQTADRVAAAAAAARSQLHAIARDVKGSTLRSKPSNADTQLLQNERSSNATKSKQIGNATANTPRSSKGVTVPAVGDMVYVPKLGRNAKVIEVKGNKKELTVQSGSLQVKVKLKEIQWPGLVQA